MRIGTSQRHRLVTRHGRRITLNMSLNSFLMWKSCIACAGALEVLMTHFISQLK